MAKGLVSDTNLTAIANAIRSKNGSSDTYTPATMAQAISDIPTSQVDQESALKYMLENKTDYTGVAAGLSNMTETPQVTQSPGVRNYTSAFENCTSLEDASSIQIGYGATGTSFGGIITGIFKNCTNLKVLPTILSDKSVTLGSSSGSTHGSMTEAFYGCSSLQSIDWVRHNSNGTLATTSVFSASYSWEKAFYGCTNLTDIGTSYNQYIVGSSMPSLDSTFYHCGSLTRVLFRRAPTTGVATIGSSIDGCTFSQTFDTCSSLLTITDDESSSPSIELYPTKLDYMFRGCSSITGPITIKLSKPTKYPYNSVMANNMFMNCSKLTEVNFDLTGTMALQSITNMFNGCTLLANLSQMDLSGITGSSNTAYNGFGNCPSLTNVSLNNILASLLTIGAGYTESRTLKKAGLTKAQATTCTGLSNWAACQAAGWTTGY